MTLTDLLNAALRGGVVAINLVMMGQLLIARPRPRILWTGLSFIVGVITYSTCTFPPVSGLLGEWHDWCKLVGITAPVTFWMFVKALLDDEKTFDAWFFSPLALMVALELTHVFRTPGYEWFAMARAGVSCLLMGHLLWLASKDVDDDLVAARRSFAHLLRIMVPGLAVTIAGIEVLEITDLADGLTNVAIAAAILVCTLVLAISLSSLRPSLFPQENRLRAGPVAGADTSAADRIDLGRLRDLMEGGAYQNTGLTIGTLARMMDLPEHRLRKLINKGLGYRNFASFVNDYRIAEARARLALPDDVHTHITSIAFETGYGSLAPFNRAFRERMGMSPSEWREKALAAQSSGQSTPA